MPKAFSLMLWIRKYQRNAVFFGGKRRNQHKPWLHRQGKLPKRALQYLALILVAITMMGASDSSTTKLDRVGHKLVCQCSCGQILMECNHVGCPVSGPMIEELRTQLAVQPAQSEKAVLGWFIDKYGPIVLAAPIRGGFDIVAWIAPFAILLLGGLAVVYILRHWRRKHVRLLVEAPTAAPTDAVRARIRQDTDTF